MELRPINALILAGSRQGKQDLLAQLANVSHKAVLPILGRPMIDYVVQSLSRVEDIREIAVSIENQSILKNIAPEYIQYLPAALGPSASVINAIHKLGTPLLITTADNPLLKPEWVKFFLNHANLCNCDVAVGIALKEQIQYDVPHTHRTYIKMADGAFSGCNLFLFRTPKALQIAQLWQKIEQYRKKPTHMAYLLGLPIIARYLTKSLTKKAIYKRIYRLTGAKINFIALPWGQAAVDVDKKEDLDLVTSILQK